MSLKNLNFASETIKTSGGEFTVRGLSLADITVLVRKHAQAMSEFFDKMKDGESLDLDNTAMLGGALAEAAPELAAEVIALASGEPDAIEEARRLTFPTQVDALEKIANLTFDSEGGVKKVVEAVIRAMTGATGLLSSLRT